VKVAFDTNVLISAYTARGLSADVFRLVLAEYEVILSTHVLGEFDRILRTKFGIPTVLVSEFVDDLSQHYVEPEVDPGDQFDFIADPDDRFVVAAAISAGANILLTGDKDILKVRSKIVGLDVYKPREFWESLRDRD